MPVPLPLSVPSPVFCRPSCSCCICSRSWSSRPWSCLACLVAGASLGACFSDASPRWLHLHVAGETSACPVRVLWLSLSLSLLSRSCLSPLLLCLSLCCCSCCGVRFPRLPALLLFPSLSLLSGVPCSCCPAAWGISTWNSVPAWPNRARISPAGSAPNCGLGVNFLTPKSLGTLVAVGLLHCSGEVHGALALALLSAG